MSLGAASYRSILSGGLLVVMVTVVAAPAQGQGNRHCELKKPSASYPMPDYSGVWRGRWTTDPSGSGRPHRGTLRVRLRPTGRGGIPGMVFRTFCRGDPLFLPRSGDAVRQPIGLVETFGTVWPVPNGPRWPTGQDHRAMVGGRRRGGDPAPPTPLSNHNPIEPNAFRLQWQDAESLHGFRYVLPSTQIECCTSGASAPNLLVRKQVANLWPNAPRSDRRSIPTAERSATCTTVN
jgi:hypothetical protein